MTRKWTSIKENFYVDKHVTWHQYGAVYPSLAGQTIPSKAFWIIELNAGWRESGDQVRLSGLQD